MSVSFRRYPEVETNLLPDGCAVLFNTKTNWAQTLTPLGTIVWEFCDGGSSVDDIVDQIKECLSGEDEQPELKQHVMDLLEDLEDGGLVECI